jgi:hypothetical protein
MSIVTQALETVFCMTFGTLALPVTPAARAIREAADACT